MKKILPLFICAILLSGISSAQTVTNANDAGAGSLRDEIANAISGATITIDPSLAGQTVTLTSGVMTLGVDITIIGADGFELSGNNVSRIFEVSVATTVSISNVIISNGQSPGVYGSGGAINILGTMTLTDCTIRDNVGFNGGAIRNSSGGVLNLNRCTLSGNSTSGNSGGAIVNSGDLIATNCTFSGNVATGSNRVGGAIAHFSAGSPLSMVFNNCTFTANSATGEGGAFYCADGNVSLSNTIVAGNSAPAGPDYSGPMITLGNNLIENVSGISFSGSGTGDITGVSANLGPLASNGGLTQTHALLSGSPAIDAGDPATAATFDQREYGRFGTADIGAFELNGTLPDLPIADVATLADITAECSVATPTAPTATDNSGSITGTTTTTFPITVQGTTTVTWSYTNANGTVTQTQDIVITDLTAPVADVAILADVTAECSVTALTDPTATDNCSGLVTVTNDATLPISAQGTAVVTWTYTDESGNSSTQTQNIVIADVTAPVADVAALADVTTECEVTSLIAPTATDNCGGTVTVTNDATFPISTQGATPVTWTYTDVNGNSSTQMQNVIITDATAPVADLATLADVTADCEVTSLTAPTATDNCNGTVIVTNDATFPISGVGTTVVTWTYTDVNGNSSTQMQNVIITDGTAPVGDVATLSDVIGDCEVTSLTAPTATDNCSGTVIVTNDATLPLSGIGTTLVTWTYDDGNGNTSTQTQNVVIGDFSSPLPNAAPLADITGECSVDIMPTAPTANDACAGVITGVTTATFPITTQGVTVITWTFDDGNGNVTTQTQNIVVNDISGPVADAATLADVTGGCSIDMPVAPTATDNCTGAITGTTTTVFPITAIGTTTIVWEYDDGNGNISTQTQNAVNAGVDATTALSGDGATITANTAGASYTWINCDFNTTVAGETGQSFTPSANGNYSVIVTVGNCSDTSACELVSTVGIGALSIVNMRVYPNPTNGSFTIDLGATQDSVTVSLTDMLGKVIQTNYYANQSSVMMNINETNGVYFVHLQNQDGLNQTMRIVKN